MRITANINGFETPIEFPGGSLWSIRHTGNREEYSIDYGEILECGGVIDIRVTSGEGSKVLNLGDRGISNLLDFQATAMDNNSGSIQESTHIEFTDGNTVRVYARATSNATIKVKWSAKGTK